MVVLQLYGKEIVALLVPILTWVLNAVFKAKARLVVASPHTFTFLVQQPFVDPQGKVLSPTQTVHTSSLLVRNTGKDTATKVELVFNWKPECVNVWPSRHYDEYTEPDNRYVMIFGSLAPDEHLGCEVFSINKDLPSLLVARSDQCVARVIAMYPQPVIANWKRNIITLLAAVGLASMVYFAIVLVQLLVLKTPLPY
jgi:hypothetical protein